MGACRRSSGVVNAYLLALASLILIGGSLGDIYGERRVFELGLVAFGVHARLRVLWPRTSSC